MAQGGWRGSVSRATVGFLAAASDNVTSPLWEGPAMDRAIQKLLPMCQYGLGQQEDDIAAQEQARVLLSRLRAEGLYL